MKDFHQSPSAFLSPCLPFFLTGKKKMLKVQITVASLLFCFQNDKNVNILFFKFSQSFENKHKHYGVSAPAIVKTIRAYLIHC